MSKRILKQSLRNVHVTGAQGQEGKYIHFRGLVDYASIHFRSARDRVSYKSYFYYIFRPEALFCAKALLETPTHVLQDDEIVIIICFPK